MNNKYRLYSSMSLLNIPKTYAEIDIGALRGNYNKICQKIKETSENTEAICVLKADAYGHGAESCLSALLDEGCRFFAVSSVEEAIDIRRICDERAANAEILILGYSFPTQAKLLAEKNIITSIVDKKFALELAEEAERAGVRVRCHIKLDTGMNRIGFEARSESEAEKTAYDISALAKLPSLNICGMFTHFAKADEAMIGESEQARRDTHCQAELFMSVDKKLLELGTDVGFRHLCNSAATIAFPEYHFDACRLGIALYGAYPAKQTLELGLRPVMRLCSIISHIHGLPSGESVSYGGRYTADSERVIATIPIGYADGFVRAYSTESVSVLTSSGIFRAPIRGRICMDQCMIDITGSDARVGDKVVLFGDSPEELSALAATAGTIEYECLCLVTSRVPRIIIGGENQDE